MKQGIKKALRTARNIILAGCAGYLTLTGIGHASLKIAHNIMSHIDYGVGSLQIASPATYFTQGHYKGFANCRGAGYVTQEQPEFYPPDPLNKLDAAKHDTDLNAIYLGLTENPLPKSAYKPTNLKHDGTLYSISDFILRPETLVGKNLDFAPKNLERILNLKEGESISSGKLGESTPISFEFTNVDLNNYTLSFGKDKRGIFTSIYDVWDFEPSAGYFKEYKDRFAVQLAGIVLPRIGEPIHFYDRIYWNGFGAGK